LRDGRLTDDGDDHSKKITVQLLSAKDLIGADGVGSNKTSDPFATLIVRNRGTLKMSSKKDKTLAPTWNEEFEFVRNMRCDVAPPRVAKSLAR